MEESIDANKVLPQNLIIKSAENKLLSIGLIYRTNNNSNVFRGILYNPLFIFTIISIVIIKLFIGLLLPEDNAYIFKIIGDFTYFLGIRIYCNIAGILWFSLAIISQLVYYYNYKNDIKPTFLKVFQMMSGLVSPKSIGLTNKQQIYKLVKQTNTLFVLNQINNELIIPMITFFISFVPLIMNCTIYEIIIYSIPHSIIFSMTCYYSFYINVWQVIYFYIVCRYIKIKLSEINEILSNNIRKHKRTNRIYLSKILFQLNLIYSEINEYNTSFWSKYLLSIWLILGSVINLTLYFLLFFKFNLIMKTLFAYVLSLIIMKFVFIMNTASSVNYEANKSYKLLNSIMVFNNRINRKNTIKSNLKVMSINSQILSPIK